MASERRSGPGRRAHDYEVAAIWRKLDKIEGRANENARMLARHTVLLTVLFVVVFGADQAMKLL